MPLTKKKWQLALKCIQQLFKIYLPFLSESFASPSCLTALACATSSRSHPITVLVGFFVDCLCIKMCSKCSQNVHVGVQGSINCGENPQKRSCVAFRRNFSQGKCAMLSNLFLFFSCLFSPVAIADF